MAGGEGGEILQQRRAFGLVADEIVERDRVGVGDPDQLAVEPAQHAVRGQFADAFAGMEGDERLGVSAPITRSNQRLQQRSGSGGSGRRVLEATPSAERTIETMARQNASGVAVGEHAETFQFGTSNANPWIGRGQASPSGNGEGSLGFEHGARKRLGK